MAKIKIFALGGLGENGKNMYVVEVNDRIFILDAGLKYPDIDMYGVDAVVPNINYLIENKNRIEGIFLSHGHEDQINALPYLLKNIQTRVYGTHFTISLLESLLSENKMNIKNYKLFRINENKVLNFSDCNVTFFNTSHSIPESVGIAINTTDGSIVYCTDFNFAPTSFGRYQTSFDKINDLSKGKVLALLSESISAGSINRIKNDSMFEHTFKNILVNAKGRIIVGAYSSALNRIQSIVKMAVERGKKVAIVSTNHERFISVSIKSKYLSIPKENFVTLPLNPGESHDDLVVIVAGIRNEPYRLLVRMAKGEDKLIKLDSNDTTVVVCPPISGNEKYTIDSLNSLYRFDANVTIIDKPILRSTHADKEDLRLMYTMLKPKYIIPIKGEYRHMYEQSLLAEKSGFSREQIFLLDNGDALVFENGEYVDISKVPTGDVFVDGTLLGNVNDKVIKEREILAEEGAVIVSLIYDARLRKVTSVLPMVTKGLSLNMKLEELEEKVNSLSEKILNNQLVKKNFSIEDSTTVLCEEVGKLVYRFTKHRPAIIPVIQNKSK